MFLFSDKSLGSEKSVGSPFSAFSFANTAAAKAPGFSDLANQNKDSPFTFAGTEGSNELFGKFNSTPSSVFGSTASKPRENTSQSGTHEDGEDEFVPTAEFAPVIPLPPLVEVKKGDEDDNTIYQVRAKLLRFDNTTNEWKERGLGDIKILQNKMKANKVRVVMWREQIHKLACNHYILKEMKIDFYQKNPKILMWSAFDYAEGEGKTEMFVCKFGKEETVRTILQSFYSLLNLSNLR